MLFSYRTIVGTFIHYFYTQCGYFLQEIDNLFDQFDSDKSGSVNIDEFLAHIRVS